MFLLYPDNICNCMKLLSCWNIRKIENYRYENHSLNKIGEMDGIGFGTLYALLSLRKYPQDVVVPYNPMSEN
jgi:hypothetical protein